MIHSTEKLISTKYKRFSKENLIVTSVLTLLYLIWTIGVLGLRQDHLFLLVVCLLTYYINPTSRKFFWGFLFFILYWLLYDSMRVYPNYLFNPVHIQEPYLFEKSWFGVETENGILTPNEYFELYSSTFLDILSALFYLCWVPVPLAYAGYLFVKDRRLLMQFAMAFFGVNVIGISIYYLYPAAPPWYVAEHGFDLIMDTPGNAAGLLRFDEYFGISLFADMYNKNANVFAAIPSLHSAFPVLLFYFGLKKKLKYASLLFLIILVGIWFAAVYTYHHYIIDVLIGGFCALLTILIFEWLLKRAAFNKWMDNYMKLVS